MLRTVEDAALADVVSIVPRPKKRNCPEEYDFTTTRERAGPQKFLADFTGYLQADAYGGYDGIYSSSNDPKSGIVEVACWVHCRRYWHNGMCQRL